MTRFRPLLLAVCLLSTQASAGVKIVHPDSADRASAAKVDPLRDAASAEPLRAAEKNKLEPSAREMAAYRSYNQETAAKNPKLGMVLDDPDRFVADLKGRFEKQKGLTPADPYAFDFSDYGLPVLAALKDQLAQKTEKVSAQLQELEAGSAPSRWAHRAQIAEHKVGLEYLAALSKDVSAHLDDQAIGYRRLLELSYFSARALGHFDLADLSLRDRVMLKGDRYLQGYRATTIAEEQRRYDHDEFTVFQAESPVGGFKAAQKPFETAFLNPEKLDLIALPTTLALDGSELMRLVPYNIFLLGITDKPFPADGFVRPGGDFWLHDVRHSSAIFAKRKAYEAEHGLSEAQTAKLQKNMDVWKLDLDQARAKVDDSNLGEAIDLIVFNTHHDRGMPIAPSSFLEDKLDFVPRALYATYRLAGQSAEIRNPHQTMDRAYAWLKAFWTPRLGEETALWSAGK